jgi:hypothetical protein
MSPVPNDEEPNSPESVPDSSDVLIIEVRGNEDPTTRPLRPVLLEWAKRQASAPAPSPEAS